MSSTPDIVAEPVQAAALPALDLEILRTGAGPLLLPLLPTSEKAAGRLSLGPTGLGFRTPGALYLVPRGNGVDFESVPSGFTLPFEGGVPIQVRLNATGLRADPSCALRLFVYDAAGALCAKLNLPLDSNRPRPLVLPEGACRVALALRLEGAGEIQGLTISLVDNRSFASILGASLVDTAPSIAEARALIADLQPGELVRDDEDGDDSQLLGVATRLIAQGEHRVAIALLAQLSSVSQRGRRLLARALHAIARHDQVIRLHDTADAAFRGDVAFRLRYLEACARTGAVKRVGAMLDESLFGPADGNFIARACAFLGGVAAPLANGLRAHAVHEFVDGTADFRAVLAIAHAFVEQGDGAALGRVLAAVGARERGDEDQLRIDLLAGQAAFRRGAFDRQLAWLNAALARQRLLPLTLAEAGRAVSPGGVRCAALSGGALSDALVTVVIVAQDAAATIGAALRSILDQRHARIALVVVDRGSHDGTAEVVRGIADPRLLIETVPRETGYWAAYEQAAAGAAGRYLMAHPADGWAHPQKIERLVAAAIAQSAPAVLGQRLCLSEAEGFACGADYLQPDTPALLYEATPVRARIGVHDDVAIDGDAEFLARVQREFGLGSVVVLPDLLQFSAPEAMDAALDPARLLYRRRYLAWHQKRAKLRLEPGQARPFDLPPEFIG